MWNCGYKTKIGAVGDGTVQLNTTSNQWGTGYKCRHDDPAAVLSFLWKIQVSLARWSAS